MFKQIVSFLLLLVMLTNLAIPLLERLGGKDVCELAKLCTDKSEKEGKTVKELEKEAFGFFQANHFVGTECCGLAEEGRKPFFPKDDHAVSELYASSPERPPDA